MVCDRTGNPDLLSSFSVNALRLLLIGHEVVFAGGESRTDKLGETFPRRIIRRYPYLRGHVIQ